MEKWRNSRDFSTVDDMKTQLRLQYAIHLPEDNDFEIGYMEPGHGLKGRKRWIHVDDDLRDMYAAYGTRKEVVIWCAPFRDRKGQTSKRPQLSDNSGPPSQKTKFAVHSEKMSEVEEIIKNLKTKHDSQYTDEQLRVWAHMIHLKKHDSMESPPCKPFFKSKTANNSSPLKPITNSHLPKTGASPSRKIGLRSECIKQLSEWHTLYDKGGITEDQYRDLKSSILGDIKDL